MQGGNVILKSLELIVDDILVTTDPFTKSSFFTENGPAKLFLGDNFRNWVLVATPDTIPAFEGKLTKTQLTKDMHDSDILTELGASIPFTVAEFSAIIRYLIQNQPNGESGLLLADSHANIFYLKFEDGRAVTVHAFWPFGAREWFLCASSLAGASRWCGGSCVFSRS